MKKLFLSVAATLLSSMSVLASPEPATPDFAFPRKVISNADSILRVSTNQIERLSAVMNIVSAQISIDPDSAFVAPAFVSRHAAGVVDPSVLALYKLLEARILCNIYSENRYKYNQVPTVGGSFPDNIDEWSGEQFKIRCNTLADSALMLVRGAEGNKPIDSFKDVINIGDNTAMFFPRIRDFVWWESAAIADPFDEADRVRAIVLEGVRQSPEGTLPWAFWSLKTEKSPLSCYEMCPRGETRAYLLLHVSRDRSISETERVRMLKSYLDSNSINQFTEVLQKRLTELTNPVVLVKTPSMVQPGKPFTVTLSSSYAESVEIMVRRVIPESHNNSQDFGETVVRQTVQLDPETVNHTTDVSLALKNEGRYYLGIYLNGKEIRQGSYINCTPYVPVMVSTADRTAVAIVSAETGAPLKGATVLVGNYPSDAKTVGTTGDKGSTMFYYSGDGSKVFFKKGDKIYRYDDNLYIGYNYPFNNNSVYANFMVARPLYHPGETIEWSAILARYDNTTRSAAPCVGIETRVALFDANYEGVDTLTVTTDEYGRVSGHFRIPDDRLTGNYTLQLIGTAYSQLRVNRSTKSVMVSDFKVPVFEVKEFKTINGDGKANVSGRLLTYTGIGVADATVTITANPRPAWWLRIYNEAAESVTVTTTSDSEGYFSVDFGEGTLKDNMTYTVEAVAASPAGETALASCMFVRGNRIGLVSNMGDIDTSKERVLPLYAMNLSGDKQTIPASWALMSPQKDVIRRGECTIQPAGTDIDLSHFPAGEYLLGIMPADTTVCSPDTFGIVTYSTAGNQVPACRKLIVPQTEFSVEPGQSQKYIIGVPEKTVAYIFTSTPGTVLSVERHEFTAGFHELKTPAVKSNEKCIVTIAVHTGLGFETRSVTVTGKNADAVRLTIESWRDNIVPNTPETITLSLAGADGKPVAGALVATMYNKALDDMTGAAPATCDGLLYPELSWSLSTYARVSYASRIDNYIHGALNIGRYVSYGVSYPSFLNMQRFRQGLTANGSSVMIRGAAMMNRVQAAAPAPTDVVEEESASTDSYLESRKEAAGAIVTEDGADVSSQEPLRPGESLQGLWMPSLTFGTDGLARISYNVPDAIGSWRFVATSWNKALSASSVDTIAIASKPVMVQPNWPRFLRAGDAAEAMVTIYNNTDADEDVSLYVGSFDASGNSEIDSKTTSFRVAAHSSVVKLIKPVYRPESDAVVMRVKATMANYTDGQQNIIPILASDMLAIDSKTFYLTDEAPEFEYELPSGDSHVVLKYCANPVWDVVKALPGLYSDVTTTSTSAVNAAFGALVARGLGRRFPEIDKAIRIWTSNPADSALMSPLMKNEDLKFATLQQTPWVWNAASATTSMQRLTLTFDKKEIKNQLDKATTVLENLQQKDGGFAWGQWSGRSSFWTTAYVLETLGRLNSLGGFNMTERLDRIVAKAFSYLENNEGRNGARYAFVASMYPDHRPSTQAALQAIEAAAQHAVKNWKSASTVAKAQYALLLNATGYAPVAKEIVGSLRQYEVKSPQAGISFPSVDFIDNYAVILQAFATIDPQRDELDAMCQWLTLRSQVTSDLGSWNPTMLIASILTTAPRWTMLDNNAPAVMVNGQSFYDKLDITRAEAVTGTFAADVSDFGNVRVSVARRASSGVSYGSVNSVGNVPLDEVEASGSDEISITKRFLVLKDDRWQESTDFVLGEPVKVQLLVKVSRDLEYVTIVDNRPAAFEPLSQLPGYERSGTVRFYRESNNAQTRLFIDYLPHGTYYISLDMAVSTPGEFASGPAVIQSQYAPELNARSGSSRIDVKAQ